MNRDDFLKIVYDELKDDPTNDRANRIIDAFDSVDTEPIRHGKWRGKEIFTVKEEIEMQTALCSNCKRYHTTPFLYYFEEYNFCPNCGAKMNEERIDNE